VLVELYELPLFMVIWSPLFLNGDGPKNNGYLLNPAEAEGFDAVGTYDLRRRIIPGKLTT